MYRSTWVLKIAKGIFFIGCPQKDIIYWQEVFISLIKSNLKLISSSNFNITLNGNVGQGYEHIAW